MDKLKWGVLSTGRMSDWFCGDFHAVEDGELAAVASRTTGAAERFAQRYDIPKAYGDYRALFDDPDLDVIYVSTPHSMHLQNAGDALRAGKAVLCEKPLTVGAGDCETLIKTAQDSQAYLMEALWTYFLPAMRKAKEWVRAGRIGDIVQIKTDFGYPIAYGAEKREYDPALGGGCLLEMGVYPVAIARYFAEQDPLDIQAYGFSAPNGVEDDVTAIFSYPKFSASIGTSYRARLRNAAHIVGTDGYIVIPDAFRASACFLHHLDDCIDQFEAPRTTRGYDYQAVAVCEDVRAGRLQSDIAPHSASLGFQTTIDQLKARLK